MATIAKAERVSATGTDWRRAVEPFTGPDAKYATFQLVTTLTLLAGMVWAIHLTLQWSMLLAVVLAFPTAGLLVRTFIFMHDCAHGSFYANRRVNDAVGYVTGVLTMTPFGQWRRDHALHHASSGDLDRRGHGDINTLTVREYQARTKGGQLKYRLFRHPLTLLLVGPIHLVIGQRLRGKSKATGSMQVASVWFTNLGILVFLTLLVTTLGWRSMLLAYGLPYYIAAAAGIWLFYVQHQFEDAYWEAHGEWDYVEAALRGSSHLRLPRVLQWFTGSIGLHHVHHVAPRIPNYRLQSCHDSNELFAKSPVITLRSGVSALRLALWDEDRKRLVSFREAADSTATLG